MDLSIKAEYLERCGNERNLEEINDKTEDMIDEYLKVRDSLQSIYNDYLNNISEDNAESENYFKEAVSRETLKQFLNSVRESVALFDFDGVTDNIRLLREYKLTPELDEELKELTNAADKLEDDEVLKIVDAIEIIYDTRS